MKTINSDVFDCKSCPGGDIGGAVSASPECLLCQGANCDECLDDRGACAPCPDGGE